MPDKDMLALLHVPNVNGQALIFPGGLYHS